MYLGLLGFMLPKFVTFYFVLMLKNCLSILMVFTRSIVIFKKRYERKDTMQPSSHGGLLLLLLLLKRE